MNNGPITLKFCTGVGLHRIMHILGEYGIIGAIRGKYAQIRVMKPKYSQI